MKKPMKTFRLLVFLLSGLFFFLAAGEAGAVSLIINADSTGLKLQYNLKRFGADAVTVAPGEPEMQLALRGLPGKLVQLWIRVDSVQADQPVPVVNAVIKSSVMGGTYLNEFPMSLPFGEYGIEAGLFKKTMWKTLGAPLEISLLCAPLRTNYDITLNLGDIFNDAYKGYSTLKNNIIYETIDLPGDTPTEKRSLELTILPVKTIPLTFFIYSGGVYDDNDTLVQTLSGMIPFPNGSYHLWLKPGFDINEFFMPQMQACCVAESQICQDAPAVMCESAGGIPQGAGTTCATVDCSMIPLGAISR